MNNKVLVVEDDAVLGETLVYNLNKHGYEVHQTANGREAVQIARQEKPDLILLDLMLPGMDGIEVCRVLRREMTIPILMLTARTDEVDRVVGLEVGADDYITKPFSMRELLARIKAQLRRIRFIHEELNTTLPAPASKPLRFDNLMIDLNRCEVFLDEEPLALKPKEYELLVSLAQCHGQVLSREQLLSAVWGWDHEVNSRTVDVHIRWLRQKIEKNPAEPKRIITVRGLGYRFDG